MPSQIAQWYETLLQSWQQATTIEWAVALVAVTALVSVVHALSSR